MKNGQMCNLQLSEKAQQMTLENNMAFSSVYLSNLMDILDSMGWAREVQLASLGYDDLALADPRVRIDFKAVSQHFSTARDVLEMPDFGVRVGHKFRVSTFTQTGSVYNFSKSLADVARINGHYQRLIETAGDSEMVREGERAYLQWTPRFEDDEFHRTMTEIVFGGYATTIQWLSWGFNRGIKSIAFRHRQPEYLETYEELFQCPISFNQPQNRLEFFAENVDLSLPTSDADKMAKICNRLDQILMSVDGESDIARRVRGAIRTALSEGSVNLSIVANELGLSERTLRRHLSNEGLNFRQAVDDVRKAMFDALSARGESLTQIALMLGYNDQSAFTRAFKRWYGINPSAYRSRAISF